MQSYEEIWKDIPNYEGMYQVSNLGRVKSLKWGKERILKNRQSSRGYLTVVLRKDDNSRANTVHRLVMLAFVGQSDLQVNHINGIKADNRLENLEYCTPSENVRHAYTNGLTKGEKGEKNGSAKLTDDDARQIKYGYKGWKQKDIAKIYGVHKAQISKVRLGKAWSHI